MCLDNLFLVNLLRAYMLISMHEVVCTCARTGTGLCVYEYAWARVRESARVFVREYGCLRNSQSQDIFAAANRESASHRL